MAPLSPQKMTKAATARQASGVNTCCAKTTPAKTKRFLTHWRGRSDLRTAARMLIPSLQADHMRLGPQGSREIARVKHQPRFADEADGVELAMGGQNEHQIVGSEGRPP